MIASWRHLAIIVASCIAPINALGKDIDTFSARQIDASKGDAVMYTHEEVLLGLSCRSGPVGKVTGLSEVRVGDTLTQGKYSFRVGIIEVTRYEKDLRSGGTTIAKKGDVECVVAANRDALPYDDRKCRALWVRITNCRPLE